MSTLRDPVGPQDRKVYVRRRLLVLAGLLAVIAVIVLVIVKPGSDTDVPRATKIEVPEGLETSAGEPADAGDAAETGEPVACTAGQLLVTPVTDRGGYAPGELPALSLTVENTGEAPCTADLGTAGMQFVVSSGDDEVWRSTDCQENPESLPVILDPDTPVESEPILWDRTRSSTETCGITREPVRAEGSSYHLRVVAAGTPGGGSAQFLLS